MIHVRELAIGNWVYDDDYSKFPMFVVTVGEDFVCLNFESNEGDVWESIPEDLQGIPLTEELLKKMGFYRNELWWRKQEEGYIIDVTIGLAYVQIVKLANGRIHSRCTCHGVRFVHELQNLFWNITKQQLKVNL